jgi:hypothetical protein
MTTLGEMELEDAAKKAVGNWQAFQSFCWHRACEVDSAKDWAIEYSHHRDGGLLDQSNAGAIAAVLEPFMECIDGDVIPEHHHHWAVGWIDGFAIRVFRNGESTEAFRTYYEITQRLAACQVLDEGDYSRREYESTLENIESCGWRLKRRFALPDDWKSLVFDWFRENNQHAVENRDDQGGYPSEDELQAAFVALGFGNS